MMDHIEGMHEEFPMKFKKGERAVNPATSDMFSEDTGKKLKEEGKVLLHRMTAKALFKCKRARPDMQPITSVSCARVKNPGDSDWNKLARMMRQQNER